MQVITMDDKDKRDEMFRRYRKEGNTAEQQVVKFSGCRPVMATERGLGVEGEILLDSKGRVVYKSTWSIAYPTRSY